MIARLGLTNAELEIIPDIIIIINIMNFSKRFFDVVQATFSIVSQHDVCLSRIDYLLLWVFRCSLKFKNANKRQNSKFSTVFLCSFHYKMLCYIATAILQTRNKFIHRQQFDRKFFVRWTFDPDEHPNGKW